MISYSLSHIKEFSREYEYVGFQILKLDLCQILIDQRPSMIGPSKYKINCAINNLIYSCDYSFEVIELIQTISNIYFSSDLNQLLFNIGEL